MYYSQTDIRSKRQQISTDLKMTDITNKLIAKLEGSLILYTYQICQLLHYYIAFPPLYGYIVGQASVYKMQRYVISS